jgi:hypothetical protein
MIEAATGVNPWREWGRLEVAQLRGEQYVAPEGKPGYAGILMTLARQEHPDLSAYHAPEVVWRANKTYHAGLIVASDQYERVEQLITEYSQRLLNDFTAVAPPMGVQRTGQTG